MKLSADHTVQQFDIQCRKDTSLYVPTVTVLSLTAGTETFHLGSLTEFFHWKEHEEEVTHTTCISRQRPYCPLSTQQGNYWHEQVNMCH